MKTWDEVRTEVGETNYHLSLEKLVGKKVKEVQGHISMEFGEPVFQLFRIYFEDGSSSFVEGQHDCPYLDSVPGISDAELEHVHKTDPDYHEDGGDGL